MPVFHYKAANISGDVVQGEMEAASLDAVIRQLQAQGHIPIRAEEISGSGPAEASPAFSFSRRRAGRAEVSVFTIELATLLQAGLPLDRALETLVGIADRTPYSRASYEAAATTPRAAVAPTMTGRPRSEGSSRSSSATSTIVESPWHIPWVPT